LTRSRPTVDRPVDEGYPNNKMVKYTHDWVYFDADTAEIRRDSLNWPQEGGLKWPHLQGCGVSL
jgi:hypothetical protein